MIFTPSKRLLKLAKLLAYRRCVARASRRHEDAYRALQIMAQYNYYLDQHNSRVMDRVVRIREEMEQ